MKKTYDMAIIQPKQTIKISLRPANLFTKLAWRFLKFNSKIEKNLRRNPRGYTANFVVMDEMDFHETPGGIVAIPKGMTPAEYNKRKNGTS